jgi:hypothetical protein
MKHDFLLPNNAMGIAEGGQAPLSRTSQIDRRAYISVSLTAG